MLASWSIQAQDDAKTYTIDEAVTPQAFKDHVQGLLAQELTYSLKAVDLYNPPSEVFGEPINIHGSFTWAELFAAVSRYMYLASTDTLAGEDLVAWLKQLALMEVEHGKTFAQLYVAKGMNNEYLSPKGKLEDHKVWKLYNAEEREGITTLLDVDRFVDRKTIEMKNGRPQNYYGVAALVAANAYNVGLEKDKKVVYAIIDKCVEIMHLNKGLMDDDKNGYGRYDRYLHEFIRFTWVSANMVGYKKAKAEIKPYLARTAKLWWQQFNPKTGTSSPYGRSLNNAWDDTFEQTAFFLKNPEVAPTTPDSLAGAFLSAFNHYVTYEYNFERHLNRMREFGRNTYSYASRKRIWSYTMGTLGKLAKSTAEMTHIVEEAGVKRIAPLTAAKPQNFVFMIREGEEKMGIWNYQDEEVYFQLPVIGGVRKGLKASDYQPAFYGLDGFGFPVSRKVPNMIPHLTVDGVTYSWGNGAQEFDFSASEKQLSIGTENFTSKEFEGDKSIGVMGNAVYKRTAKGVSAAYTYEGASKSMGLELWLPLTVSQYTFEGNNVFLCTLPSGKQMRLTVTLPKGSTLEVTSTGDSVEGKGAFAYIPTILKCYAKGEGKIALSWEVEYLD